MTPDRSELLARIPYDPDPLDVSADGRLAPRPRFQEEADQRDEYDVAGVDPGDGGVSRKPRLLDLFCGAGGAAMGYARAGFEVVGIDHEPQPHYPFGFIQADVMEWLLTGAGWMLAGVAFDAIHASPPCQAYTKAQRLRSNDHPNLIAYVRRRLVASGLPYVIENVPGAPLQDPITLCGLMFGLGVDRDRLFESNVPLVAPSHPSHDRPKAKMGRAPAPGEIIQVVGHFSGVEYAREAMGIDWMVRDELKEAIPPAYTEWLGARLVAAIEEAA